MPGVHDGTIRERGAHETAGSDRHFPDRVSHGWLPRSLHGWIYGGPENACPIQLSHRSFENPRPTPCPVLPLAPRQVLARPRIDPHRLAFVDEERYPHGRPRLEFGRLRSAGRRIATQPRGGFADFELH